MSVLQVASFESIANTLTLEKTRNAQNIPSGRSTEGVWQEVGGGRLALKIGRRWEVETPAIPSVFKTSTPNHQ